MKSKYASLLLLFICIVFAGCKAIPDEVKERMEQYGDNKQMSPDNISYCTVSELRKTIISDIDIQLDNMVLPGKVDFSGVESVETLELAFLNDFLSKESDYLKLFSIDRNTLCDEDVSSEEKKVIPCRVYEDSGTGKYFAMNDCGWLAYYSGSAYDILNGNFRKELLERYDMYYDDISEKRINIEGREVSVKKLCSDVEKKAKDYRLTKDFDYRVSDMFVSELKDVNDGKKGTIMSFVVEAYYKGIALNNYGNDSEFDGERGSMSLFAYDVEMDCDSESELSGYNTGWGSLEIRSVNKVDKVIDLNSAVHIANSELSGFNQLKIYKIIPLYALYPKEVSDSDIKIFPWTGQEVSARPVYAFLIEPDKIDENEILTGKSNYYYYIFVDMVDGTVRTNIDKKKEEKI